MTFEEATDLTQELIKLGKILEDDKGSTLTNREWVDLLQ